jgi:hypothetical protein
MGGSHALAPPPARLRLYRSATWTRRWPPGPPARRGLPELPPGPGAGHQGHPLAEGSRSFLPDPALATRTTRSPRAPGASSRTRRWPPGPPARRGLPELPPGPGAGHQGHPLAEGYRSFLPDPALATRATRSPRATGASSRTRRWRREGGTENPSDFRSRQPSKTKGPTATSEGYRKHLFSVPPWPRLSGTVNPYRNRHAHQH